MKNPDEIILNGRLLAKLLGVTEARISQLANDKIITKQPGKKGYTGRAIAEYCEWLRSKRFTVNEGEDGEVTEFALSRAKKMEAEAELAKIKVEFEKNKIVYVEQVIEDGSKVLSTFKDKIFAVPVKLAPHIAIEDNKNVCRDMIEGEIRNAFKAVHEYFNSGVAQGVQTPAKTNS